MPGPESESKPEVVMERKGRLKDLDRSFDHRYWQEQGPEAIFSAAWEMVVDAYRWKGLSERELEFQRSVENFGRIRG